MSADDDRGATVNVIYVLRRNAKTVKVSLENDGLLHKQYRMTQPTADSLRDTCIAIPVTEDCLEKNDGPWTPMIVARGRQHCPYSSSFLGTHKNKQLSLASSPELSTQVQQALLATLIQCSHQEFSAELQDKIIQRIRKLSVKTCPKKLEVIGDDRTLVIPRKAFLEDDDAFASLLALVVGNNTQFDDWSTFWKFFGDFMGSPRVARRGDIDPDSCIRESGHRLLFPHCCGQPDKTGPGSSGWITITEQGISQSFDMTRVMFSRGNITEKIRFGNLVQEGEIVLDMYAGIGYYTLPALVHGKAGHVYACEWNEHAANALTYNLSANGVEDRVTVLVGDCRQLAREYNLVNMFDRISLGLLPSSEGGWRTAVKALRKSTGGWLHVHGNVPDRELSTWKLWMCKRLFDFIDEEDVMDEWVVLCVRVERVKSYAPQIHHHVADVFLGPLTHLPISVDLQGYRAGVLHNDEFEACPSDIDPPSCALSPDGALHQTWMMDNTAEERQECS